MYLVFSYILGFANIFRKKTLNEIFEGTIAFNNDYLIINNLTVKLSEIEKYIFASMIMKEEPTLFLE